MSPGLDQTGQIAIDDLGSFMPWAIQIDSSLRIRWIGPSLQKHGLALAVGDHADQHLEFKRPAVPISRWDDLVSLDDKLIIWRVNGMKFDLRGAIHVQASRNDLLLVGSPVLRKTDDFDLFGITLSDFARHDSTPDLLLALQARDVSILQAVDAVADLEAGGLLRQSILDSAMDAMITIDMEGLVVEFNNAAVKMFGFSRDDVIGKSISESIIPPEMREAHKQGLLHYRRTGKGKSLGQRIEFPALRADGTRLPIEMAIVPFKHQDDGYFTASIRDLTNRQQAEATIERGVEQERLLRRELDHRVKNMLAHLVALCRRAASDVSEDGAAIESLVHRIESMSQIHDLLGSESRCGLEMRQLVEVCIRPYQTCSESVMINGAELRLRDKAAITLTMVFNELAVNASKYGALHHEGGVVKIAWEIQSDDEGASSLMISWEEVHDAPVPQSLDGGLGTEIIRAAIGYELGGTVVLEPTSQGILFLATVPVAQALLDEME
jgi:PAS domain S-box-containing protein